MNDISECTSRWKGAGKCTWERFANRTGARCVSAHSYNVTGPQPLANGNSHRRNRNEEKRQIMRYKDSSIQNSKSSNIARGIKGTMSDPCRYFSDYNTREGYVGKCIIGTYTHAKYNSSSIEERIRNIFYNKMPNNDAITQMVNATVALYDKSIKLKEEPFLEKDDFKRFLVDFNIGLGINMTDDELSVKTSSLFSRIDIGDSQCPDNVRDGKLSVEEIKNSVRQYLRNKIFNGSVGSQEGSLNPNGSCNIHRAWMTE